MRRSLRLLNISVLILSLLLTASCGAEPVPAGSSSVPAASSESTPEAESTAPAKPVIPYVSAEGITDPLAKWATERIDPAINAGIDVLNEYTDPREVEVFAYKPEEDRRYDSLNEASQGTYRTMYEAVCAFDQYEIRESDLGTENPFGDVIDAVYAIYHDDPVRKLYWADGGDYYSHRPRYFTANDDMHSTDDLAAVKVDYERFCAVFDRILECVPEGISNYRKCQFFTAVICAACTYDVSLESELHPFQAYDALVEGTAVCAGYTEAFQLLCHAAGINCKSIQGHVLGSDEKHIWNVLDTADGARYTDVTWTDAEIEKQGTAFWFEYFMIEEQMMLNSGHQPDWDSIE